MRAACAPPASRWIWATWRIGEGHHGSAGAQVRGVVQHEGGVGRALGQRRLREDDAHAGEPWPSNAIKFTPDGGSIELRVAYDAEARVVTLSMVDDGIGIAPEDQARIFERFVQVDSTPRVSTTAAASVWHWCANTATCKGSPCRWKASSVAAAGSSSRFPRARSWAR